MHLGKVPWRRTWQPAPVFLSGKSHGQTRQSGYSPRGHRVRHDCTSELTDRLLFQSVPDKIYIYSDTTVTFLRHETVFVFVLISKYLASWKVHMSVMRSANP